MARHLLALAATVTTAATLLASCGGGATGVPGADGDVARWEIVTGFYPLQYATQMVVGDVTGVTITSLASPGAEAHDVELTPRQVANITDSDLVVFSGGMQPAVDEAVAAQSPQHSLDVAKLVDLLEADEHDHAEHSEGAAHEDHADEGEDHADHEGEDHADEGEDHAGHEEAGEDHAGHDHGGVDPHFWLDPQRYATAGEAIAEELAAIDPGNADTYRANAQDFSAELTALDEEFATTLANCEHDTLVTTHQAFGYLADRYGFHQVGITGISPDAEASPARMAEIADEVQALNVPAIYAESTLGGDLANVIASETDTEVLVLDPIESVTPTSAGDNYFEIMRANLSALSQGQGCS